MSNGESDAQRVDCPQCLEGSFFLPNDTYKFYAEHYYRHALEDKSELVRQQAEYELSQRTAADCKCGYVRCKNATTHPKSKE